MKYFPQKLHRVIFVCILNTSFMGEVLFSSSEQRAEYYDSLNHQTSSYMFQASDELHEHIGEVARPLSTMQELIFKIRKDKEQSAKQEGVENQSTQLNETLLDRYENIYIGKSPVYSNLKNRNPHNEKVSSIYIESTEKEKPKNKFKHCCNIPYYYISLFFSHNFLEHKNPLYLKSTSFLEDLPNEIIREITAYLNPLSIIKLSHVSRRFMEYFDDSFWRSYNLAHNYQNFNEESTYLFVLYSIKPAPPLKVMIANYYYATGIKEKNQPLIKKSSLLGLSTAQNYFTTAAHFGSNSYSSGSGSYRGGYDSRSGAYDCCYKCGIPMKYCRCMRWHRQVN